MLGDDAKPVAAAPDLAAADQLYRAGKFAKAEASYRAALQADPKLVPAQVGLVRAMLRQQRIDESLEAVNAALAAQPDSAALLAARGDVQFRRGDMSDAESSYLAAMNADPKEVHAYLRLARLYVSSSLYRKAYDLQQSAHQIAPDDEDVRREWWWMLPWKERLAPLEAYLSGPHPNEDTKWMEKYLEALKAPVHACRLAGKVDQTETKLETMHLGPHRIGGIGLPVTLNGRSARLLLDTGAGGILVSHSVAKRAGLVRISSEHLPGIGDEGLRSGYTAVADRIGIGELEFQDCVVHVINGSPVNGEEGLIGADVFGSYLIDIDLPGMELKLSPLPKRPEDTLVPKALNSEGEEQTAAEGNEGGPEEQGAKDHNAKAKLKPAPRLPRNRYIAPGMTDWTKVFHFANLILVPTMLNDSKPMLFALDTGAIANVLSVRAAQQVGKVSSQHHLSVRGVNGDVDKVYRSAATLQFGHLRQANTDILTFDLSALSRQTGTEISGLLGFGMLRLLDVKLDYRDGLVDFAYDPKRVPAVGCDDRFPIACPNPNSLQPFGP